jgi:predicted nucleic acid-binding protein
MARRIRPGSHVVTTEWVLGETWTLVNRRIGHSAACACIDAVRRLPGVEIEPVTAADLAAAWQWLQRHDEREYSFVDAVSFSVMRRRRLTDALAFDGDFAAAGFMEIRP